MRNPDLIIGPRDNPQTRRWHLLHWRGLQISLHEWCRSDDDRALHDHSGHSISILLTGCYMDLVRTRVWEDDEDAQRRRPHFEQFRLTHWGDGEFYRDVDTWHKRLPFVPYYRPATQPHRVALIDGRRVWTIWIRFKPIREWGFHCPKGWKHWKDYIAGNYKESGAASEVGRGCG